MRRKRKINIKDIKGKMEKVVPDTSAIINKKLTELIESKELDNSVIIIPEIVIGELQAQASKGQEIGFIGLEEVKKIRDLAKKHKIKLEFYGERPSYEDILLAKSGRIDALIQDVAKKNKAVLITCDLPQALVAEAQGIEVKYYESYRVPKKIKLENFLTKDTMSLHLKEGVKPLAKRGKPGDFKLVEIRKKPMKGEEMEALIKEIMDTARYEENAFVEYNVHGISVIQLRDMRIAIARPPFSSGLEITVVRPIVKLTLNDYELSKKLKERLERKAEGILIAGPPGSGKSTFAASLAEFYLKKGKIVKTMENPRDLQVPKEVTQYGQLDGSFSKTANILLLVRPDYTIFDEVRRTKDFEIFADMRLAGVGMIGVVHATDPIDAIQRSIRRIDLGIIPHVIDTIIFIKDGKVKDVYSLSLTVRVPKGMTEADLARPVVEVRDFENGKLKYEIYTYGDQTIVTEVEPERKTAINRLASERILQEIRKFDKDADVEMISEDRVIVKVRNSVIPRLIGKEGKNIRKIEEKLGINIEVEPTTETLGKEVGFKFGESGAYILLSFGKKYSGKSVNIYVEGEYLFTATVGRKGDIKITKSSDIGKEILKAKINKKEIKAFI